MLESVICITEYYRCLLTAPTTPPTPPTTIQSQAPFDLGQEEDAGTEVTKSLPTLVIVGMLGVALLFLSLLTTLLVTVLLRRQRIRRHTRGPDIVPTGRHPQAQDHGVNKPGASLHDLYPQTATPHIMSTKVTQAKCFHSDLEVSGYKTDSFSCGRTSGIGSLQSKHTCR